MWPCRCRNLELVATMRKSPCPYTHPKIPITYYVDRLSLFRALLPEIPFRDLEKIQFSPQSSILLLTSSCKFQSTTWCFASLMFLLLVLCSSFVVALEILLYLNSIKTLDHCSFKHWYLGLTNEDCIGQDFYRISWFWWYLEEMDECKNRRFKKWL